MIKDLVKAGKFSYRRHLKQIVCQTNNNYEYIAKGRMVSTIIYREKSGHFTMMATKIDQNGEKVNYKSLSKWPTWHWTWASFTCFWQYRWTVRLHCTGKRARSLRVSERNQRGEKQVKQVLSCQSFSIFCSRNGNGLVSFFSRYQLYFLVIPCNCFS